MPKDDREPEEVENAIKDLKIYWLAATIDNKFS